MTTWAESARPPAPDVFERIGRTVLRLFTSVDFAVVQIIVLSLLAVVGMTIRQLPSFAFRSVGDYEAAMAEIHARYDAVFGRGLVDALERLQVFHVFSSTWFTLGLVVLVVSIVVCTLERTPKLWRQSAEIRVVQPDPFYDPELPDRAAMTGVSVNDVRAALRRRPVPRPRGGGRWHALPVRRPPSLDEAGDALHAPGADPVPRRGGRYVAAGRRAGPASWRRVTR